MSASHRRVRGRTPPTAAIRLSGPQSRLGAPVEQAHQRQELGALVARPSRHCYLPVPYSMLLRLPPTLAIALQFRAPCPIPTARVRRCSRCAVAMGSGSLSRRVPSCLRVPSSARRPGYCHLSRPSPTLSYPWCRWVRAFPSTQRDVSSALARLSGRPCLRATLKRTGSGRGPQTTAH